MHYEPGVVTGAKWALGAWTLAGAATVSAQMLWENLVQRAGAFPDARQRHGHRPRPSFFFELLRHLRRPSK